VLSVASALMIGVSASAATIYDNSVNDLSTRFNPGATEVGDEIILAGSQRMLTSFSFEFFALNNGTTNGSFADQIQARVRFYQNNGPLFNGYATPGTNFYDSGFFTLGLPTDRSVAVFSAGLDFPVQGLVMPVVSNFTWSVQFRGGSIGDSAGVDIYGPPVVGQGLKDYWEFSGGTWTLKTNNVAMNFAAKFDAVPEPSTVVFGILGGLGILIASRRFANVRE